MNLMASSSAWRATVVRQSLVSKWIAATIKVFEAYIEPQPANRYP